ncbi:hypothetical protein DERF_011103 [Dermatophagoides farinae]|uniref:Secreted protein n=1 Tax=Dermatophagoides farinae TaxID=6954 RepID=A0A922L2S4_DERFA|nr:hypothetical protein HUG17_5888 [Dermatophagoides farinae]KAH9506366.1 hypothetical protein DERF_011103 [Dermatophagoides farinae]
MKILASVIKLTCIFSIIINQLANVDADSGDLVTPWTPYRTRTKAPPHFVLYDLFNLPKGEVVGGQYIRRCFTCDMPRLFKAKH